MKCQKIENHLSAYMDRELPAELAAAVREHLADCPACRGVLAELEATAGLLRSLPQVPAPGGLAEAVGAQIRNRALAQKAPVADKRPVWPRICAAAAAVFLVAGVGYLLINEKGTQDHAARLAAHHEEAMGDAVPLLAARAPTDSLARGPATESITNGFFGEKRRSGEGGEGFLADRSNVAAGRAAVRTSLAKAAGEAEANGPVAEFASKADDLEDGLRRGSKVGEKAMIATAPATARGPAKVLNEVAREAGREATKDTVEKVARAEVAPEGEDEVLEKEASELVGFDHEEDEAEAVAVLTPKSLESLESQEIHFKKRGERDAKDERVDVAASRPGVRDKEMEKIAAKAKPDAGWDSSALRKAPKPGAASSPEEHKEIASTRADLNKLEGAMRRSRSNVNEMKVLAANANKKNLRAVKNQLVLVPRKKAVAEEALMELFARNRLDPVAGQAGTLTLGGLRYQRRLSKGGGSRGNFYRAGGNGEIVYLVTMDEGQLKAFNKDLSGETRLAVALESSPQFQNVRLMQMANWGVASDSRAVAKGRVVLGREMMQTKAKGKGEKLGFAGTYEDGDKDAARAAQEQPATDNKLALEKQGAEEPRQQAFAGYSNAYKAEAGKKTMTRRVKALEADPGKSAFEQKQKIATGRQRASQVRRQVLVVVRLRSLPLAGLVAPAAKAAPKARKSAPVEATTESAK